MAKFTIGDLYNKNAKPDKNFMLLQYKFADTGTVYQKPFEIYQEMNENKLDDEYVNKFFVSYYKELNGMTDVFILNLINRNGSNQYTLEVVCTNPEIDRILYGTTNARKGDLLNAELVESMHTNEEYVIDLYRTLYDAVEKEEEEM